MQPNVWGQPVMNQLISTQVTTFPNLSQAGWEVMVCRKYWNKENSFKYTMDDFSERLGKPSTPKEVILVLSKNTL